ncbi:energy transducer TonB [Hymenobacter sp. B1770]|uniref:energy transducer TonB n=1 Tax=Hymenobacter sp. B1770 TaxID=1718788 RepID=UPI003CEAACED
MMTNSQLATASLDDIVFDGRNRHYGAYELRALYQRHMTRALIIATALCALLLVLPVVAQLLKDKAAPVAVTEVFIKPIDVSTKPDIVITPPPPAAVKPAVQPPKPPTIQNVAPVVTKDSEAPEKSKVPDQEQLIGKTSGLVISIGEPGASPDAVPEGLTPGDGNGVIEDVVKDRTYTFVEQMPELPGGGGTAAIVAAIQRAVKYPSLALSNGVEGRVFVSFTVNPKGEVVDVAIVKGLGSGLDEETMRAIRTLPKFIPGKQNGREVSVSFTVPVTYKIQ